jgi:hypothetical protein
VYSEDEIVKQQREIEIAAATEKELWVCVVKKSIFLST